MQQVDRTVPDQLLLRPQFSAISSYQGATFLPSIPPATSIIHRQVPSQVPFDIVTSCAPLACCLSEMFVEPRRPGTYVHAPPPHVMLLTCLCTPVIPDVRVGDRVKTCRHPEYNREYNRCASCVRIRPPSQPQGTARMGLRPRHRTVQSTGG